jgi:uncharacterized damage-inducible protein DinB
MTVALPLIQNLSPYYQSYLPYIKEDDLLVALNNASDEMDAFLQSIPAEKETFRYAENKWMVKEVVGHLADTERILTYRALRFARNDQTPVEGFEENDYVKYANFNKRPLRSIGVEFMLVREATLSFFNSLEETDFDRTGTANKNPVSVRSILFFIIAHQRHHFKVISERYLAK